VRFHIHPDVRVSRLDGGGILLKLPGGEGWRFRAGGGQLEVEESVYLGAAMVRRTEQLVINGSIKDSPAEIAWVFEQVAS
ncbi:MAG TPA: heparinase II/III family protein, partial [Rhizorhapis sp.]|nr:heparinase II/III family protein [Rhizorhapis sp.]